MSTKKTATPRAARPRPRPTLAETMQALEKAGSAQARKTYARHGATGPMFGVSFATLHAMMKKIGVDHELAVALWDTGNLDARNLAVKIVDPSRMKPADLDRWVREGTPGFCGYVATLAGEGAHGRAKAEKWLASKDASIRSSGWALAGHLAQRDESLADAWFAQRLQEIQQRIHAAPNAERDAMNRALIVIGGRNPALRRLAVSVAKRVGKVHVDYGDTDCKVPDAIPYLEKTWAHARAKGFDSPAAQERARPMPRLRC